MKKLLFLILMALCVLGALPALAASGTLGGDLTIVPDAGVQYADHCYTLPTGGSYSITTEDDSEFDDCISFSGSGSVSVVLKNFGTQKSPCSYAPQSVRPLIKTASGVSLSLRLEDVHIITPDDFFSRVSALIHTVGDLRLTLGGVNSLTVTSKIECIRCEARICIDGTGSLSATVDNVPEGNSDGYSAISVMYDSGSYLQKSGDLTLRGGKGFGEGRYSGNGLSASGNVTIEGGSLCAIGGAGANGACGGSGLYLGGSVPHYVKLSGGSLTAIGGAGASSEFEYQLGEGSGLLLYDKGSVLEMTGGALKLEGNGSAGAAALRSGGSLERPNHGGALKVDSAAGIAGRMGGSAESAVPRTADYIAAHYQDAGENYLYLAAAPVQPPLPPTGDGDAPRLWLALALAAAVATGCMLLAGKRSGGRIAGRGRR